MCSAGLNANHRGFSSTDQTEEYCEGLTADQIRLHPEKRRMLHNVLCDVQRGNYTVEIAERLIAKLMTIDMVAPLPEVKPKAKAAAASHLADSLEG